MRKPDRFVVRPLRVQVTEPWFDRSASQSPEWRHVHFRFSA